MPDQETYPALEECVAVIATAVQRPASQTAQALLCQANALGKGVEELVHEQFVTALKRLQARYAPTADVPMADISGPAVVEIDVSPDRQKVWINVDGMCRLRVQHAAVIKISDGALDGL